MVLSEIEKGLADKHPNILKADISAQAPNILGLLYNFLTLKNLL